MKDSLNPTLKSIKKDLLSNKINKLVFSNTESTIISEANIQTPVWTGDLLKSITNYVTEIDSNNLWFGAKGGHNPPEDPFRHTDPENYAWKVGGEGLYFNKIFNATELMFINSFEKEAKEVLLNNTKNSYGR